MGKIEERLIVKSCCTISMIQSDDTKYIRKITKNINIIKNKLLPQAVSKAMLETHFKKWIDTRLHYIDEFLKTI